MLTDSNAQDLGEGQEVWSWQYDQFGAKITDTRVDVTIDHPKPAQLKITLYPPKQFGLAPIVLWDHKAVSGKFASETWQVGVLDDTLDGVTGRRVSSKITFQTSAKAIPIVATRPASCRSPAPSATASSRSPATACRSSTPPFRSSRSHSRRSTARRRRTSVTVTSGATTADTWTFHVVGGDPDAAQTWDPLTMVRADWDGDGAWDSDWVTLSRDKGGVTGSVDLTSQFALPGHYNVVIQARDGYWAQTTQTVAIDVK